MGAAHGRDDGGGGVHSCNNVGMGWFVVGEPQGAATRTWWIVM
jgi:hypothetical protein